MPENDIQTWLKQAQQAGYSDDQIREQLRGAGWSEEQIQSVLGATPPQETPIPSGELLGLFPLMGQAFVLLKRRISHALALGGLWALCNAIVIAIIILSVGSIFYVSLLTLSLLTLPLVLAGVVVSWIVVSFIFAWFQGALLYSLLTYEQKTSIVDVLRASFRYILPFWWLTFLIGLVVTGASFLFIIPGILFAVWFIFSPILILVTDARGFKAMLQSREYVRGIWWRVFWRDLAFGLIVGLVAWLVEWAINNLLAFFLADTTNVILTVVLVNFVSLATFVLFIAYATSFSIVLFQSIRSYRGDRVAPSVKKTKIGIIVTAIIGWIIIPLILTIITATALGGAQGKARDASRKSDLSEIRTAAYLYYDEHGSFPTTFDGLMPYLYTVPLDPKTNLPYTYKVLNNGADFQVCATLEVKSAGESQYCLGSQETNSFNNTNIFSGSENADSSANLLNTMNTNSFSYGSYKLGTFNGSSFLEKSVFTNDDLTPVLKIYDSTFTGSLQIKIVNNNTQDQYYKPITVSSVSSSESSFPLSGVFNELTAGSYTMSIYDNETLVQTLSFVKQ